MNFKLIISCSTVAIVLLLSGQDNLYGQEQCDGRLVDIEDPSSFKEHRLFLKDRNSSYLLSGFCFNLDRRIVSNPLKFFVYSDAPENFEASVGVLMIKSIRTFVVGPETTVIGGPQTEPINIYRNNNWYVARKKKLQLATGIDRAVSISIPEWNKLHLKSKKPEDFGKKLGPRPWHAYATNDRLVSSADYPQFWSLSEGLDADKQAGKQIVKNYLIRFDVNRSGKSPVGFDVGAPPQLQRVELSLKSNIVAFDDLRYLFLIR